MSERKVLNKYYPPDFDPAKIPKLRLPRNRQYSIRIMAPFNMRCETCGEYIYKGKKFNSRKETVEDENYLGLYIFRFYIKCPRCVAEIAFKTDPEKTDYALEAGATRNFEASRTAEELARKEIQEKEDEEKNNPMKVLENRTKASRQEMEMIETLEELRDLNSRHAKVDHQQMLSLHTAYEEQLAKLQDEEDENFVKSVFGHTSSEGTIKRLHDSDEEEETPRVKLQKTENPTDILTQDSNEKKTDKEIPSWEKSVGSLSSNKTKLSMMIKKKPASSLSTAPSVNDENVGSISTSTSEKTNTATMNKPAPWEKSVGSLSSNKTKLSMMIKKKPASSLSSAPSVNDVNVGSMSTSTSEKTITATVKKPAPWEKSVGSLSSNKTKLGMLVKKKDSSSGTTTSKAVNNPSIDSLKEDTKHDCMTSAAKQENGASSSVCKQTSSAVPSALGLLGSYSDSDSDNVSD